MQIRKNISLILVILAALVLIAAVFMFFNPRIQKMETKGQVLHSENIEKKPLFIIQSTSRS